MYGEKKPQEETPVKPVDLIMVVDDDRDIVTAIVESLGKELPGAKFLTSGNGQECLGIYESSDPKPDIIILDMMLPGRSGFLVMEKIKRGKKVDDAPIIIMITGNQGPRHKVYAEYLGAFRYLLKPFRMETLLAIVLDARSRIS